MGGVVDELEVGLRIEVEDGFGVVDPDVARGHGGVGDDGLDGEFVLGVDVVVGRGEHHVARYQPGVLRHLGDKEAVAEHIQRHPGGHVVAPGIDHQIKISPIARKSEVRMTRRAVKRIVSRVKSLKHQLAIGRVGAELLPDPLELVEWFGTEVLPLHVLLGADLRPGPPAPSVGSGQAALSVGEEVPEVLGGAEIADPVVPIDVPHELPEEVADGHLAQRESGEAQSQVDLDGLAEHLLVAEVIAAYDLSALVEDLSSDLDVLEVEGEEGLGHGLTLGVMSPFYHTPVGFV